jgi:hypothetical protein
MSKALTGAALIAADVGLVAGAFFTGDTGQFEGPNGGDSTLESTP